MKEPDIILRGIEGSIVGLIPGLRGRAAVEEVIRRLLGDKALPQQKVARTTAQKGPDH